MPLRVVAFVVLAWLIPVGLTARADGLIFQLPPDGTWARYTLKTEAKFGFGGAQALPLSLVRTLTVSSVGEVKRNDQTCRWIELELENKGAGKGLYQKLILKLLIPQDYLRRGEDPLAHPVLTFFDPKPADRRAPLVESYIDEGFNRIQYEIERFRNVFPKPLDNPTKLKAETVETPAGKFEDCEVIAGTSSLDGQLVNNGRTAYHASYRLFLHPKAPFGLVAMHVELKGTEYGHRAVFVSSKDTLTLSQSGKNAASHLRQEGER
jgi:hypothetical protein